MKIGIYNDWWYPDLVGGTERSALEISKGLVSYYGASKIVIATLSNSFSTEKFIIDEVQVIRVGSFTLRRNYITTLSIRILERIRISIDILSPFRVARVFRRHGVNTVIVHNMDRVGVKFLFILKRFYRIRIIRIVHDLGDTCIKRTRFRNNENCKQSCFSCRPKSLIYKHASSVYFDSVICNSKFTMNKLTSLHFIPKNFNYGYINLPLYYSDSKIISHSSCKDFAKIGYVGRISPEKGIEILFESLQLLKSNFQIDSELFVVGKGNWEYIAKLKLFASKLDITVQFVDYNDAPYEFLGSRVDLIVIPSKWEETFGRVAFEASVNGFQVMVSDIGGLPEAASLSGKDFFTFTPGDANDLARKIRSFVSGDKPNRIGMAITRSMLKQIIASINSD